MAKTWHDEELNLDSIKNEIISVIGYGIQGAAQASNLKDSGLNVILGARRGVSSWQKALDDGHQVLEIPEAVEQADIIHVLIPDMEQPK